MLNAVRYKPASVSECRRKTRHYAGQHGFLAGNNRVGKAREIRFSLSICPLINVDWCTSRSSSCSFTTSERAKVSAWPLLLTLERNSLIGAQCQKAAFSQLICLPCWFKNKFTLYLCGVHGEQVLRMSKPEDEKHTAVRELKSKIDANNATLKQVRT